VRRMRDDPALGSVLIMMLSSTDRASMAERCHELGVSTYLHKPIREDELLQAILQVVGPAGRPEDRPEAAEPEAPRTAERRLCILLAEDNPHNQRVVKLMLARESHSTTIVNNGREAVEEWGRRAYDLVLMDVQMPEMDGFQATAAIRA